MTTLAKTILAHAETQPDAPAIEAKGQVLTYAALRDTAYQAAHVLEDLGIAPGDRVGLNLRETQETVVILLGLWIRGATPVLIDFRTQPPELAKLCLSHELAALIHDTAPEGVPQVTQVAHAEWTRLRAQAPANPKTLDNGGAPAFRSLTSGTSGTMAAFDVSHPAAHFRARSVASTAIKPVYRRFLSIAPMSYGGSQGWVINTLINAGTVVIFPSVFRPSDLIQALARLDISGAALVPATIHDLLAIRKESDGYLGRPEAPPTLITTGAHISPGDIRRMVERLSPDVWQWYAASPVGAVAGVRIADHPEKIASLGQILPGLSVEIVDDNGDVLPPDQVGRLRVLSGGRADRIIGRQKADGGDYIEDGWYYSGDLGYMDQDGFLYFAGRAGDAITRAGVTFYPAEIEAAMATLPGLHSAAAVAMDHPRLGQDIALFVVAHEGVSEGDIKAHARAALTPDKQPGTIRFLTQMPLNANGKIKRRELQARLGTVS